MQTLHSHTKLSDGVFDHFELLDLCQKYGLNTIAFTDHDILPSLDVINNLKRIRHKVNWISGIEISSGLPKDLGGKSYSGLHIIGLFVNPTNKKLLNYCQKASKARIERMEKIVKNLQSIGFDVSEQDCMHASGGESVARPHIVLALKTKPQNLTRMEEIRAEMSRDQDSKVKEKYLEMMSQGESQYPYVLFLSEDSFIKDIYVDYLYWLDLDSVVNLIRQAGGLAFIAHYPTAKTKISYEYMENLMREKRIDGIETVCAMRLDEIHDWKSDLEWLEQKADEHKILKSGGIDLHREEQLQLFTAHPELNLKTQNMIETIIAQSKVDTTWSSL